MPTIEACGLTLSPATRYIAANGQSAKLTHTETSLLALFMQHPDTPLTRLNIMLHVWHTDYTGDTRILEAYICRLRSILTYLNPHIQLIHTLRSVGYQFGTQKPQHY